MKFTTAFLMAGMLVACAVAPPDDTVAFRSGAAVVQDVRAARVALPRAGSGAIAGSEAAGGRYGSPVEHVLRPRWVEGYQLTLRMDDGSIQRVTQDSAAFLAGDRVQVMADGRIVKTTTAAPAPVVAPAPAVSAPVVSAPVVSAPALSAPAATAPAATTPAPIASVPLAPAPATPAARAYRPGIGIVESATVVALSSSASAAAGGTSGPTMAYRLKMNDGTTQDVVQTGRRFEIGDRVLLTRDGRVAFP
jgi:outer membrane lipoprotein SlyB